MACAAVPPWEVFHQAREVHRRNRGLSGSVGVLRGVADEVADTEKTSSCRASAKNCSIGLRESSRRDSKAVNGIISLPAMAGGLWDAAGFNGGFLE